MAQGDYNIQNQGFPAFRSDLNSTLEAINSSNSGTSRPSSAVAGTVWLDTTSATTPTLKFYDGADDISLATLDYTANTVNWLDSNFSITGLSTSATGTVFTLTDTSLNSTVDIQLPDTKGIEDDSGNEYIKFSKTASAVNELTITNNTTGNNPILSATGDDTNIGIEFNTKGTGVLTSGSSPIKIAGKETIWIPSNAMYPTTTAGAEAGQIELTAGQPELKCLDFDASTDEKAQFSVAFPKSWNEGNVTFQAFFTANSTNTGNAIFTLSGVAVSDDDAIDSAFGTAQSITKAHSGTANDLDISSESSAITISGTPASGDQVFFQVTRDADNGSDTLTSDARLLGIKLFFTTDSANDS